LRWNISEKPIHDVEVLLWSCFMPYLVPWLQLCQPILFIHTVIANSCYGSWNECSTFLPQMLWPMPFSPYMPLT